MFELNNQKVIHKLYGIGYIEKQDESSGNTYIWVRFDALGKEKDAIRFRYPDSFSDFIQFEDFSLQQKALEDFRKEREKGRVIAKICKE